MKVSITSVLYMVAAAQALLLIFVIARKKQKLYSERYLIAVLVGLMITLLHYVAMMNRLTIIGPAFLSISAISWLTVSPLLFLYSRSLVGKAARWKWSYLWFFPLSLYFLLQIVLELCHFRFGFYLLFDDLGSYTTAWIMVYLVNSLVFAYWSMYELQSAGISSKHRERIRWLISYFRYFYFVLILLIAALIWCWSASYFVQQFEYYLLIFYTIFIFVLTVRSLRFSNYFNSLSNEHYGHDRKQQHELAVLLEKLRMHMETEKSYLQPKLTLSDLSKSTGISENQLSQIFTRYLHSSFYRFVNEYRLKEFELQLAQHSVEQYTIMGLATSSGFISKSTFYKVFKEHYGLTPSEFIKQQAGINPSNKQKS